MKHLIKNTWVDLSNVVAIDKGVKSPKNDGVTLYFINNHKIEIPFDNYGYKDCIKEITKEEYFLNYKQYTNLFVTVDYTTNILKIFDKQKELDRYKKEYEQFYNEVAELWLQV